MTGLDSTGPIHSVANSFQSFFGHLRLKIRLPMKKHKKRTPKITKCSVFLHFNVHSDEHRQNILQICKTKHPKHENSASFRPFLGKARKKVSQIYPIALIFNRPLFELCGRIFGCWPPRLIHGCSACTRYTYQRSIHHRGANLHALKHATKDTVY